MRNKKIKLILPAFVLAAGAFWGAWQYGSDDVGLPPLYTVEVERGDVSQRVVAHGTLQPVEEVEVGSQVSGIVEEIHVDFNSPVSKGEVIAQIDPSTFATAVSSAEAELDAARADLELARMHWQRVQELGERRFVAPSEVEQANASLRQAEAEVNVRRHALERAQRELDYCTIYAPTDGLVISRDVDVGQTVAASLNAPLLFLIASDLRRMHIHANVSEADIGSVQEDQSVSFQVDAYRGEAFSGQVVQVRNSPQVEDNVVHYETIISVDNSDGRLKPGMTAEVAIVTAEVSDVVRVRNTALRARLPDALLPAEASDDEEGEETSGRVYTLRGDELVPIAVRTGLSDELHTEILSGVDIGETLVVGLALQETTEDDGRSLFGGNQAQF